MIADADIWQVMCGGDIYQADIATLKQWIAEGLVQQTDQVRKGNLRWLEAGRVPALRRAFTGEEQPGAQTPQPSAPATESHAQHPYGGGFQQAAHDLPVYHAGPPETSNFAPAAAQPYAQQPAPPQHYAPDPFAPAQGHAPDPFAPPSHSYSSDPFAQTVQGYPTDAFAPPARQYSGDPFAPPAQPDFAGPAPDAFAAPRYAADPSCYAPETSHYAVSTSGFTPEAAGYAPAAPQFDAPLYDETAAHSAHAADPFYVPQSERPDAAHAAYAATEPQFAHVPDRREFAERASAAPSLRALGRASYAHPQLPPRYLCRVCQTPMCGDCVKYVDGSRVALCPLCGDLCSDYRQVYHQARSRVRKASGFGLGDFGEAIGYPFRNLIGLVGISIFYSILSLGGIKGQILAYIVIFGCMSLVIKQLAWGRLDRGFLPDFTSMSLWDDVAVPCFLGIGVTLITWGLAIVIFVALLWGVFSNTMKQPVLPTVATNPGLAMHEEQFRPRAEREQAEARQSQANPSVPVEELAQAESAGQPGAGGLADPGFDPETGAIHPMRKLLSGVYGPVLLLLPLLAVALLWGFFYYPMALTVAGYTEDFWAVVNPLVGFDTIRRMGWNYAKVFLMYAFVQVFALVAGVIVYYSLAAFQMPLVGNLPARFIEGGISFYTNLVIAALLGLALYKSSDRLGIATD
jgi:hypothetical protein